MTQSADRGNGFNWFVENWPYLVISQQSNSDLAMLGDINNVPWFRDQGGHNYVTLFGRLELLTYDATNHEYNLLYPSGNVITFNDFDPGEPRQGLFKRYTDAGGGVTAVTANSGGDILQVDRSATVGGVFLQEQFEYTFLTSGPNIYHLSEIVLRRKEGSAPWADVSRATYTYYGASDPNGSLNDLQTVTQADWTGSAWVDTGVCYYRYWLAGDPDGFAHGIKFSLNNEAYAKMVAASLDPLTASDGVLSQYADFYYEYDGLQRVTKEIVSAGTREFTLTYTDSAFSNDYNQWKRKTVETKPDGSETITYSNYVGKTMLKITKSGTDEWYLFVKFDSVCREILTAASSAITGYDDTKADLLDYDPLTGKYQYLRDNDGLISLTEYYTTTGSGAADGYVQHQKIQQGQLGTPIKLKTFEYTSHSAGGFTVYPVSKEIVYPDESPQTVTIETSYSYTFHSGSNQIERKTTTWPVISTAQNGSNSADSRIEVYDIFGKLNWVQDERGFITRMIYDAATGALVQRINDVDTAQVSDEPSGWTTPTGGGRHLVTDYEFDVFGRPTQELGPAHSIDLGGTATTVRTATWTVYDDVNNIVRTAGGYATGTSPSYTYTLVNPVSITVSDKNGNVLETIVATRASTSGKLLPSDTFAQTSYVRWATNQYSDCCKLISTRMYYLIPSSGSGSAGTNYNQTDFGYDVMDRRNRVLTPGGTITRTVFDVRSLPISVWVGTDDTGATASDPTGGGAGGNNMVRITASEYDGGVAGGDGNLTEQTADVDSGVSRVTAFLYDWRNRRTATDGEIDFYETSTYDNLNRVTKTERFHTTSGGTLLARSDLLYDDLSRVYRTIRYGVDPTNGSVGNALTDNVWYDASGNVIKTLPSGSRTFQKSTYDGLGRPTVAYVGYDLAESSYADAGTVTGDTILEQTETTYDAAGAVIQTTTRQRYHSATGTGNLTGPSGTQPKARVTYTAAWQDGVGRTVALAAYGTNGGSALSRPSTIPTRSDTVLVTSTAFNSRGEPEQVTDPAGTITYSELDQAGRRVKLVENYQTSSSSSSSSSSSGGGTCGASDDANITTLWTYNADSQVVTLTAVNAATGDQVTRYAYGTTLADSDVASQALLRAEIYPDSDDIAAPLGNGPDTVYDRLEYTYNRQGQPTTKKDQNETVHAYDYDLLGRSTQDRVTALGSGVDGTVRRIGTAYDVRSLVQKVTSYDNAVVGSGSIVNEVQRDYNGFAQMTKEYQAHAGAVNTGSSPKVQYTYADGSANHIRPTSLTYPNGRVLYQNYGAANSMADVLSRVAALIDDDGTSHLADYAYLGTGSIVEVDEPQPELKYTLIGTAGGDDPDTGDIYRGLDRFGRVKDLLWRNYNSNADVVRIQHGYDRASNRKYREDPVAAANTARFDEVYGYDGLYRLTGLDRGTLNGGKTAVTNNTFDQCWTLDATGNWPGFRQDDTGNGTWDLVQARASNKVNEITAITETTGPSWATSTYDRAGNMTSIPTPADPTQSFGATYDAWNRLVKLVSGTDTVQENAYDGLRRRTVQKTYTGDSLTETRHAYYSFGWQALEERLGSTATPDRQFVWGQRYIDDLILRDRDPNADGSLDERLYAMQDPNWNLVAVSDTGGDVQERYAYDAYGVPRVLTPTYGARGSSSYAWETRFGSYRYDATGLYAVRNRFYQPGLGTWVGRDPEESPRYHLYLYGMNAPINRIDPLGLEGWYETTMTRIGGASQIVGGAGLMYGSVNALFTGAGLTATLEGAPLGIPTMALGLGGTVLGYDMAVTGTKDLWTGQRHRMESAVILDKMLEELDLPLPGITPDAVVDGATAAIGGAIVTKPCAQAVDYLKRRHNYLNEFYEHERVQTRYWKERGIPTTDPFRRRRNVLFHDCLEFKDLSHTYIPNKAGIGKYVPNYIKNRQWNYNPMWASEHAAIDAHKLRRMTRAWKTANPNAYVQNPILRQWGAMPTSHRWGAAGAGALGAGAAAWEANTTDILKGLKIAPDTPAEY